MAKNKVKKFSSKFPIGSIVSLRKVSYDGKVTKENCLIVNICANSRMVFFLLTCGKLKKTNLNFFKNRAKLIQRPYVKHKALREQLN